MWDDFRDSLESLRRIGRLRRLRPLCSEGVSLVDETGNRCVNFGTNDYLGLARYLADRLPPLPSVGARASGLICGWTDRHAVLAQRIAELETTSAAVIFPSGFAACSGTVATLARRGDLILSDQLNHASLIDGCRLSKADRVVYPHRDVEVVADILATRRSNYHRAWIVTDGVFSMDGHLAPLRALVELANRFQADLIVDEAHGTGVLGTHLSGACEALDVKPQVAVRIGTLSKAFGGQGGFVACDQVLADYLVNHCRTLVFSTALALPAVEAALAVLADLPEAARRRDRVCELARRFRSALGQDVASGAIEPMIPIIPIPIGSDRDATELSLRLREQGMYVPAIRPPTVPEGKSRLRVSVSADHNAEQIDRLAEWIDRLRPADSFPGFS